MYDEQIHVQEYYELNAFVPVFHIKERNLGGTPFAAKRLPHNIRDSVKRVLRRNPQVLSLIQHEICVL
jgi:hypothetical protein